MGMFKSLKITRTHAQVTLNFPASSSSFNSRWQSPSQSPLSLSLQQLEELCWNKLPHCFHLSCLIGCCCCCSTCPAPPPPPLLLPKFVAVVVGVIVVVTVPESLLLLPPPFCCSPFSSLGCFRDGAASSSLAASSPLVSGIAAAATSLCLR